MISLERMPTPMDEPTSSLMVNAKGKGLTVFTCLSHLVLIVAVATPPLLWLDHRGFYSDDYSFVLRSQESPVGEFAIRCATKLSGGHRPLGGIIHGLSFGLFGERPMLFGLLLIAMHQVNAWLLYGIIRAIGGTRPLSVFGAVLFAWMPWHGQAIYWPICLSIVMSQTLLLASYLAYIHWLRRSHVQWTLVLSLSLYGAALLAYEHSLSWFFVWPVTAIAVNRSPSAWTRGTRGVFHMGICLLVAAFAVIFADEGRSQNHPHLEGLSQIGKLVHQGLDQFYFSLAGFRSYHLETLSSWWQQSPARVFMLVVAVGIVVVCLRWWPRGDRGTSTIATNAWLVVCGLMIVGPIALMTLPARPHLPNRSTYLTSVGISMCLIVVLDRISRVERPWIWKTAWTLCLSSLACFGITMATRSKHFSDAWRVQEGVYAELLRLCPEPASDAVFVVIGVPNTMGPARAHAFAGDSWGMTSKLRMMYRMGELEGRVQLQRFEDGRLMAGTPDLGGIFVDERRLRVFRWDPGHQQLHAISIASCLEP